MRQQINLYQSVLIDKQEPLQIRQALVMICAFIGLLVLISLFGYWQLHKAEAQLVALEVQRSETDELLKALEQKYPLREKSVLLAEELTRTEQRLVEQKQLLNYFVNREDSGNQGILDVLAGLARHRHQGVWLNKIQLTGDGENIQLSGSAMRPEQVPAYLQSLGENDVLNGQVFTRLKLVRLQESAGQVEFSLESNLEENQ